MSHEVFLSYSSIDKLAADADLSSNVKTREADHAGREIDDGILPAEAGLAGSVRARSASSGAPAAWPGIAGTRRLARTLAAAGAP